MSNLLPGWSLQSRRRQQPLPPPLRIVFGLSLLVLLGTLILMFPFVGSQRPLYWNEALFTATSALSVTGLSVIVPATDLTLFGQIMLLLLIQLGGVGFMVAAVVLLRLIGRRISLVDRLALSDSLGLLSPTAIVKLTSRVLMTVLLFEILGALLLYLHWRNDPRLNEGQAAFYAIFHAVSAFCNAGFDLFSGMPQFPEGIPRDSISIGILGTLIFLGGLGIPVLGDFFIYWRSRRFSLHTRITMGVIFFLILLGGVGFILAEIRPGATLAEEPWPRQVMLGLFQSISARTAGMAGVADFAAISSASQFLIIILMFIGCAPASMGGGTISLWSYTRGYSHIRIGGRTLAVGTTRKAAAVLTISLIVVLLAIWLILMTHDSPIGLVAFEVVSAFATSGLSLGMTSQLNLFGQLLICLTMFWGRLGALTIIVAIARPQSRPETVQYPEEQILIG